MSSVVAITYTSGRPDVSLVRAKDRSFMLVALGRFEEREGAVLRDRLV
ncbi:MAG TPA: hypothetical protein VLE70_13060 [Anaerolineae bacterium]|jgi:hypothetical protein|nr:hypothetical protein [Anaerolineae bacterium]